MNLNSGALCATQRTHSTHRAASAQHAQASAGERAGQAAPQQITRSASVHATPACTGIDRMGAIKNCELCKCKRTVKWWGEPALAPETDIGVAELDPVVGGQHHTPVLPDLVAIDERAVQADVGAKDIEVLNAVGAHEWAMSSDCKRQTASNEHRHRTGTELRQYVTRRGAWDRAELRHTREMV